MVPDGDLTLAKISLDAMHRHACWHCMVRVSMAAGVAVDIVVGSIPCEVSKPPLLPQK